MNAANEARSEFLQEEALASELIQQNLAGDDFDPETPYSNDQVVTAIGEVLTDAAQAVEGLGLDGEGEVAEAFAAVAGFNRVGEEAGGAVVDSDQASFTLSNSFPGNFNTFAESSQAVQNIIIEEATAAAEEATAAVEGAIGEVTGLSGRISTLQARIADMEAAVVSVEEADTAQTAELARFNNRNDITAADASVNGTSVALNGGDTITLADGEWSFVADGGVASDYAGLTDLIAALQANTDALAAQETAADRLATAMNRVIEAEGSENTFPTAETDFADGDYEDFFTIGNDGEVVPQNEFTDEAPLTALYIQVLSANEAWTSALAELTEARELDATLTGLNDDVTAARDVLEEDFNLELQDLLATGDEAGTDYSATSDNDLFLFNAVRTENGEDFVDYTVEQFGEQGIDHIFFGSDYQLVALEGRDPGERVGSATELEVFWEQEGANLILYVESEAASGTDLNENGLTMVTITEFNAEDVVFENGLLSSGVVEIA